MFVGHYSVAFACRTERNKIPLWVLFVAVQFLDYVWATLVLLGIEKLRVIKGFTAGSMLDSYYHPYSHSLIAAVLWSSMAAIGYKSLCSRLRYPGGKPAALIVGVAVGSSYHSAVCLDFLLALCWCCVFAGEGIRTGLVQRSARRRSPELRTKDGIFIAVLAAVRVDSLDHGRPGDIDPQRRDESASL